MARLNRVLLVDSGTTYGMGGWQISRYAANGLKALGVETRTYQLSSRIGLMNAAFAAMSAAGKLRRYNDASIMEWASGALAETALLFKPDLVLAMKGTRIAPPALEALKAAGFRTAAWTMDDPYELEHYLQWSGYFDMIFTSEPRCLPVYEACAGVRASLVPHAFDPSVHFRADAEEGYRSDICFIGAAYPHRVALFESLAPLLARHDTLLIGDWAAHRGRLPGIRVLNGFVRDSEAVKYYRGAKIALNVHRLPSENPGGSIDPARVGADGINSRTFEIAGCGAFQITDAGRPLLADCFEPGREIETFADPAELGGKIERYLSDDEARRRVADAGMARAAASHTYAARLERILEEAASGAAV